MSFVLLMGIDLQTCIFTVVLVVIPISLSGCALTP